MSYSFRRIDSFLEYERSQGRHWKKRSENQLYYSVNGNSRHEYPVLWISFSDLQCHNLADIEYEINPDMGYLLYHHGVWNQHNVINNARNIRVVIDSIIEIWG
ncbi:hypothetical protein Xbed_02945 [Xenorhabdus beddingii]|uniref:Uncharacterized protein n=1 Tax=Xenorhabdus beddingii TaxID=40578 RepID=A0A1Y2SL71_9GAMM|nr:hypothetical protein [Xenorhabdus beddingii]OTA18828.1 hypothetical protein Xbed_02945 [Xenorhabdus beddingii]